MCWRYDTKVSDGETLVLEFWGMGNTPSLELLPGPLWPREVVPVRVPSMGQNRTIQSFTILETIQLCAKEWIMLHINVLVKWFQVFLCANKWALACLKMLFTNYLLINHIYKKHDLPLNNKGWYAIKP